MCTELPTTKLEVANLPSEITINKDWIELRKRSIDHAEKIQKIDNQLDFEDAEMAMKRCSTTSSSLEKVRKDLVKPFNAMSKSIKKMTDNARKELEGEKTRIKGLIGSYMNKVQEEQQKALEEHAEEVMSNPFAEFEEEETIEAPSVTKTLIKTRSNWTYKVTDIKKVPREFLTIDTKALNTYIKANKENALIDGIEVIEETVIY